MYLLARGKAKEAWRARRSYPAPWPSPSRATAARRGDAADSPGHYTMAQANVDVASYGQPRSGNR